MKKTVINIPEGIQYLGEIEGFELQNGLINKGGTGCGATTLAITDKYPTILAAPRKYLLINKSNQFDNVYWYTPEDTKDDKKFKQYLEEVEIPKILVTYDSFDRVVSKIDNIDNYRIVVDEFHRLLKDSTFKGDVEFRFLNSLSKFNYVSYISATPIRESLISKSAELSKLDYFEYKWSNEDKIKSCLFPTSSPQKGILDIIDMYQTLDFYPVPLKNGDIFESREAVIFINSVKDIVNAIKTAKLTPEECNIIVADSDDNKKMISKIGKGFKLGSVPLRGEPIKKFTFCTSTAFDGVDMYSDNAMTWVISNYNLNNLLIDVFVDLPQIAGRQRLDYPLAKSFAFIYCEGVDLSDEGVEELISSLDEKIETTKLAVDYKNSAKTSDKLFSMVMKEWNALPESVRLCDSYMTFNEEKELFEYNELMHMAEVDDIMNLSDYKKFGIKNIINSSDKFDLLQVDWVKFNQSINYTISRPRFEDKMKQYCEFRENTKDLIFSLKYLDMKSEEFSKYYNILGADRCRANSYSKSRMDKEIKTIIALEKSGCSIEQSIVSEFPEEGMIGKDVKAFMQKKFDEFGIDAKAKATSLQEFVPAFRTNINVDGKRKSGWKLEIHR